MRIFSSLGDWAHAHKAIAGVACFLGIAALGAGIFFGWQEYEHRQSSEYALEQLKTALKPANPHELAMLVDFKSISEEMTASAKKVFPFLAERKDADHVISHNIQKALLKKSLEKEHKSQFKEDESELAQLRKPLSLLPADFMEQLVNGMKIQRADSHTAVLAVNLHNEQLKQSFPVILGMEKGYNGWIIRHLENADELAQQLREALLKRYAALRQVYLDKNAETTREMNEIIALDGCTADAGMLSDGKTFVLIVRALAQNRSKIQVNNVNLDTIITGKSGHVILRRFLNTAQPIEPGEKFDHRWSFDFENKPELVRALLQDAPLRCKASWQTLTLNNGKVLHIDEVPNPGVPCTKPGHDHPAAFCELPVFLR